MAIRERAFARVVAAFRRHGAVAIDTPVFELRETLTGKYGEDSKLIYDLADQGGEALSLRYDLTVPFARYVALHGVSSIKRYHVARVYRRDQPAMARGRFREFYQCDFDVAGAHPSMVPDAEVLAVLSEVLDDLGLTEHTVKLNHRGLLDALMAVAGVPAAAFRATCSAIDKLDKEPWAAVRREMVVDKGLPEAVADKIGEFVVLRGEPRTLLAELTAQGHALGSHPAAAAALADLALLFDYLEDMGALGRISFDLSLARGLDYYTGVIYEAVLAGAEVGSIAAGGRYDGLVGMFAGRAVPAVGVSIGIERVFTILEGRLRAEAAAKGGTLRESATTVLVASAGAGMQRARMALAAALWREGVAAEFGFKPAAKVADQLAAALRAGVPFLALLGPDELARGVVKLKDLAAGTEEEVPAAELPRLVRARAAALGEREVVYRQEEGGGNAAAPAAQE
jgi:histidyl-tRNA synthetase